jgi:hypothetical protein
MSEPLLIFVAGPYTSASAPDRERNVAIVHGVIKQLIKRGHFVLECHSLEHAFSGDDELTHADFLRQTLNWLPKCGAIFFVSKSPGANLELAKAEALGIEVFYSLDQVPTICGFEEDVNGVRLQLRMESDQGGEGL